MPRVEFEFATGEPVSGGCVVTDKVIDGELPVKLRCPGWARSQGGRGTDPLPSRGSSLQRNRVHVPHSRVRLRTKGRIRASAGSSQFRRWRVTGRRPSTWAHIFHDVELGRCQANQVGDVVDLGTDVPDGSSAVRLRDDDGRLGDLEEPASSCRRAPASVAARSGQGRRASPPWMRASHSATSLDTHGRLINAPYQPNMTHGVNHTKAAPDPKSGAALTLSRLTTSAHPVRRCTGPESLSPPLLPCS